MFRATFHLAGIALLAAVGGCGLTVAGIFAGTAEPDGSTPVDAANDLTIIADVVDTDAPPTDAGPEADVNVTESGGECPDAAVRVAGFCIDRTEVTNAAYARFLAAMPDAAAQPAECAWNMTFVPFADWPPTGTAQNVPVDYVDWCDAFAYCNWAGGRLCGKLGGGGSAVSGFNDAGESQWFHACSHGDDGAHAYPYGNNYNAANCNGPSAGRSDAGTYASCNGGYPGVFDMSGNVWEWEDSCTGDAGASDSCRIRGGSWSDVAFECAHNLIWPRNNATSNIGFRCCAD